MIFSSPSLRGPYTEHPSSPMFVGDMSRARPAGRVVVDAGGPLRFGQDNREGYGKRVRMVKIKKLSVSEYDEEVIQPDPVLHEEHGGWNSYGMHHLSAVRLQDGRWVAAVDGNAR